MTPPLIETELVGRIEDCKPGEVTVAAFTMSREEQGVTFHLKFPEFFIEAMKRRSPAAREEFCNAIDRFVADFKRRINE